MRWQSDRASARRFIVMGGSKPFPVGSNSTRRVSMNPNDEPDFENLTTAEAESCMKASNREMNIHLIVQRSEEIGSSGDLMLLATHVLEALPADVLEDLEKKHTCIFAQPSDF